MIKGKILVLLALVCGVFATVTKKDGIYNITEDNYEEFVQYAMSLNATFYIKFYTPMCPHCQDFKPIYIEAAKVLESDPDGTYLFAEVNTQIHETLGKHFQIRALPTVYAFSPINNYMPITYEKPRTVFDLVTEMEVVSGLINKELPSYDEFNKRLAMRNENIMLGIFTNDKNSLYSQMQKVKEEFNFVRMYYTLNVQDFKTKLNLGSGDNFILMFHNKRLLESNEIPYTVYSVDKYPTIRDFILEEYPNSIDFLNDKVEKIYNLRPRPKAILYTPFENRSDEIRELALQMKPLAKKYKGKFNMYLEDTRTPSAKLHKFHGNATYIIFNVDADESKYRYTDKVFEDKIDVNALMEFTQLFLDGKAPKYIRTAEFNKDDLKLPVVTIIASTYNQVVKDSTKHVFIRYYDKMVQRFSDQYQMRIEWYKVGRYFINTTREDLVIAEIEIKDNDIPKPILKEVKEKNHYFFLFMKDGKDKPLIYTGEVKAEKIIKFAEEHVGGNVKRTKEDL